MPSIERGGVASFYIGGAYYEVGVEIDVKPGGLVRTPAMKSDGVAGFTTKWEAPEVTLEALDGAQVSITALKSIAGAPNVQINQNNGKSWLLYGAFQIDDPTVKIADGKATGVKLSCSRCVEQLVKTS